MHPSPIATQITVDAKDGCADRGFDAIAEHSIETQLHDMKHIKLHARVADVEEEVFGETRS